MRTRLDEIVEEETKPHLAKYWNAIPWQEVFKRIAERSFRHGVEQGIEAQYWKGQEQRHGMVGALTVQPAPAAEEKKPLGSMCAWCGKREPIVGGACGHCIANAHPEGTCPLCDRRHGAGERRKKQACSECGREFLYQWQRLPDRRSGPADRRGKS